MNHRVGMAALVLAAVAVAAWFWLKAPPPTPPAIVSPDRQDPVVSDRAPNLFSEPRIAATAPRPRPVTESPGEAYEEPPDYSHDVAEGDHDYAVVEDPTGDLALYEEVPMSPVPHHVVRGWGARGAGAVPGVVGVFVIVDPEIGDEQLAELARDIRAYHSDAEALSVRILDSELAARYDRHSDGGALAAAHLVGLVNRNEQLGTDRIEIRGRVLELSGSEAR